MERSYRILQWNIRGIRANWEELALLVEETQPIIVCLQETMIGERTCPCPTGYNTLHTPPPTEGGHQGGSAIFSRQDVPYTTITLTTTLQAVAVRIHMERTYTVPGDGGGVPWQHVPVACCRFQGLRAPMIRLGNAVDSEARASESVGQP